MKLIRLKIEVRAIWGVCPACGAKHGQPCRAIELGVHLERLRQAPETITVRDAA